MLAEFGPFQALLDAIGWFLAWLYDLVGNFGIAIVVLTVVFRLILLPLGIKQIKSMQAMQALQPKIKEIQKKYKGNKQKVQEQTMKLYQDYGINPLGGCLPLLLQFPILIAMYSVIRAPVPYNAEDPSKPAGVECSFQAEGPLPEACFKDNHLPEDSQLFVDVTENNDEHLHFLLMNLQCSPSNAGRTVPVLDTQRKEVDEENLRCGDSTADRIPYYAMLALMIGTTFYSTRQSQRATPASAQTQQTKIISRIMPITFGIFGWAFPAGLLVYWTVSNLFQIGQQAVMLRLGHIGPEAMDRRLAEVKAKATAKGDKPRTGFMGQIMERAEQERKRRQGETTTGRKPPPRGSSTGRGGTAKRPKGGPNRPRGSRPNRPKRRGR
jgi:YidC/Oxa1 family membrane protein insertase